MKQKVSVSAPGKLMLFGEHAVVYDKPCIVTAVDQRMFATVERIDEDFFVLDAPDVAIKNYRKPIDKLGTGDIPKGAKFVELALLNFVTKYPVSGGIRVKTKSQFNSQFGFGSSSASTVCTIKALAEILSKKLTNKQIFDLAYKTVLDVQGKGSGFDVAAAIYGGTIYFWTGGKVIKPLKVSGLDLIVGYTGKKVDTVTMINQAKLTMEKYPKIIEGIYFEIQKIVELAKKHIEKKEWREVGELMNFNQGYLEALGVSDGKLSQLIYSTKDAGGYGAKMSGGGGDCMIGLAQSAKKPFVERAIKKSGGKVVKTSSNAEGVRVEK